MKDIDWVSVDAVCNGATLTLNRAEARMAVRRMRHKLSQEGAHPLPGKLTAEDVARRTGMTDRNVWRLVKDFDEHPKSRCPVCREPMWVVRGIVEQHPDTLLNECPLSGHPDPAQDWEAWAAVTVKWLAQRLRAGDFHGVNRYIKSSEDKAAELLVVALAAVPDKPVEELFAWVEEVA